MPPAWSSATGRCDELVPLYRDPRSDMPVTQFDMKYVEAAGLVKFDFLGLKTLSVLKEGQRLLAERGIEVDFAALPWDDPAVYELLQRGDTVGVFQLESEGMRRTLAGVRPTGFGDIIALVSLYRPGPMDNIPLFGDRKNGRVAARLPAPDARGGAQGNLRHLRLPGAGDGGGAGARRLHASARPTCCAARWARRSSRRWTPSARASSTVRRVNDIGPAKANELFDLIDKFAGYGFNKSHAAGLCAGRLPHRLAEGASPGRILRRVDELRHGADRQARLVRRGHPPRRASSCLPPDVNASRADFSVEDGKVRYALGALKGVGEKAMEALVAEREAQRPVQEPRRFRRADRPEPAQPPPARKPGRRRRVRLRSTRDRAAVFAAAETILAHAASAADQRDQRPARPVRRRSRRRRRPDPPAARRQLDSGRAHGRRARRLRLLFLGPSGRRTSATCSPRTRCAASPSLASVAGPADGGALDGDDGRPGRGRALADLGQGPPLHDGDHVRRQSGQYRSDRLRRRACADARSGGQGRRLRPDDRRARPPRRATTCRGSRSSASSRSRPGQDDPAANGSSTARRRRSRPSLARELAAARGGNGVVRFVVPISATGGEATLLVGRDFHLDAELAARLERIAGEGASTSPPGTAEAGAGRLIQHDSSIGRRRLFGRRRIGSRRRLRASPRPGRVALAQPRSSVSADASTGGESTSLGGRRRGGRLIFLARQLASAALLGGGVLSLGAVGAAVDAGVEPIAARPRRSARRSCCRSGG